MIKKYIKAFLRHRRKALVPSAAFLTVMFVLIFDVLIYAYGLSEDYIRSAESDYHMKFLDVKQSDIDYFNEADFVKSCYVLSDNATDIAFIQLHDRSPGAIRKYFRQIMSELDFYSRSSYAPYAERFRYDSYAIPYQLINHQYIDEYEVRAFEKATNLLLVPVCLTVSLLLYAIYGKTIEKYQNESYIMKSEGMSDRDISLIWVLIACVLVLLSAVLGAFISGLTMKLLCMCMEKYISASAFMHVIAYIIPVSAMAAVIGEILVFSAVFIAVMSSRRIRMDIREGMKQRAVYSVSYVASSDPKFESYGTKRYGYIFFKRTFRSRFSKSAAYGVMLSFPLIMLFFSLAGSAQSAVWADSDYYTVSTVILHSIENTPMISEDMISTIEAWDETDSVIGLNYSDEPSGYRDIRIWAKSGMESALAEKLQSMPELSGMSHVNGYSEQTRYVQMSASLYLFLLVLSLLLLAGNIIILASDTESELRMRRNEFSVLRSIGISDEQLADILKYRFIHTSISSGLGIILAGALMFIYMQYEHTTTFQTLFSAFDGVWGILFGIAHIAGMTGAVFAAESLIMKRSIKELDGISLVQGLGDVL